MKTKYKVNMQNQLYFYTLVIGNEFKAKSFTMASKIYNVNKGCARPLY